jgi:acyl carrier protein
MTPTAVQIQDWIVARIGRLTGMAVAEIDPNEEMFRYGLDSVAVVTMATDLEKWLGYRFQENPVEAHPTIAALSRFLAEQVAQCK